MRQAVEQAAAQGALPLLVAYNAPARDCSQYSAGGAPCGDAYRAWVDAFARGLGQHPALVILEPDGLALTPADCGQPDDFDRVALIRYAVGALRRDPHARVYLDGGHSAWHPVAVIAARLAAAGVRDARGFFLNVSNYQRNQDLIRYGAWVAQCLAITAGGALGYDACPGGPADLQDPAAARCVDDWYAARLGESTPSAAHFVIDTSRNGQGPWAPPAEHPSGDPQTWCNPPGRGLGLRPTAATGSLLLDAYLWIKTPGESDGECARWAGAGQPDPLRGAPCPPAGRWFPAMALELAHNAVPPLD